MTAIGLVVDVGKFLPRSTRPRDQLRAAIEIVEAQGVHLCVGGCDEHGVYRHPVTGGWAVDCPKHPRLVTLAGAVCLAFQPQGMGEFSRDVIEMAASTLDTSADWIRGLLDGWECEARPTILAGPTRRLYLDGVRAGHLLFGEFTIECPSCGTHRYRKERDCRRLCGV